MSMSRSWRLLFAGPMLLLSACGSDAPSEPLLSSQAIFEAREGATFLPPIGPATETGPFYTGASLTIDFFDAANDDEADAVHSIGPDDVRVQEGFYLALWRVGDIDVDADEVRVEVWAERFAGSALAGCDANAPRCFVGGFEATLRRPGDGTARGRGAPLTDALDLTRVRTLPIRVHIEVGTASGPPGTLDELHPLTTPEETFTGIGPNCAADAFTLPGQGLNALGSGLNALGSGLNALGSVGGVMVLETNTNHVPDQGDATRLLAPEEVGAWIWDVHGQRPLEQNTVLLVADDFGSAYRLGADLVARLTATAGDRDDLQEAFDGLVAEGAISHGALVLHHTLATLVGAGFVVDEDLDPVSNGRSGWDGFHLLRRPGAAHFLVVAAVDTRGQNETIDTDQVSANVAAALGAIDDLNWFNGMDAYQVAVNMSFVIVPCEVLTDFQSSAHLLFEDYVRALGADNAVAEAFYDDLLALLLTPVAPEVDPLLGVIEFCDDAFYDDSSGPYGSEGFHVPEESMPWADLLGQNANDEQALSDWFCNKLGAGVVYLGSSGNFALDFPLYPAAWPRVVGVGSVDAIEPSGFASIRSSFANAAETTAPGSLLLLGRDPPYAVAYAGTSFSAPAVSAFTALDLGRPDPACDDSVYSDYGDGSLAYIAGSLLSHGDADDSWLPDAVTAHCPATP